LGFSLLFLSDAEYSLSLQDDRAGEHFLLPLFVEILILLPVIGTMFLIQTDTHTLLFGLSFPFGSFLGLVLLVTVIPQFLIGPFLLTTPVLNFAAFVAIVHFFTSRKLYK
jgi:hypothetical protein